MKERFWPAAITLCLALLPAAASADEPGICFGTEPFWSLDLTEPGTARFSTPDTSAVDFQGSANTLLHRPESIWRGRAPESGDGDLVAFLREGSCSDGMSDVMHPYAVNVSMPDGIHLHGCCRVAPSAAAAAPLEHRTWRLVELAGHALPAVAGPGAITANFDGGRVHGFSGCNQFTGSYTRQGERLLMGNVAGTMMACPESSSMALERQFLASFSGTLIAAISGESLVLTREDGQKLRFEQAPAPRLVDVEWEVTGYNNGRQAVVSPIVGSRITLLFEDGTVSGSSGCNRFTGGFTLAGDDLEIQLLRTTRKACPPELMDQEQAFLAALQSATKWAIVRGMLDVHRADGQRALTASPAEIGSE